MDCYVPGEIIIWPRKGELENFYGSLSETLNREIDVISSVTEILHYYHIEPKKYLSRFDAFPFIIRVNEGEEKHLSIKALQNKRIAFALPNYCIWPNYNQLTINDKFIDESFSKLNLNNSIPFCGQDVKIAILDTGINREELVEKDALFEMQYDIDKPGKFGGIPYDPVGHGSLIAHIINRIAPKTKLYSVKIMEDGNGNLGSLINGIFLAETAIEPDIYNLSLSISIDIDHCRVCHFPIQSQISYEQISKLFDILNERSTVDRAHFPFIVAAAGNNKEKIAMPACFENICAVGSYRLSNGEREVYSCYNQVPENRFILAPGGNNTFSIAEINEFDKMKSFYGTSVAAAYISGVASKILCSIKRKNKDKPINIQNEVFNNFKLHCKKPSDYDSKLFGLGLVSYQENYCDCNYKDIIWADEKFGTFTDPRDKNVYKVVKIGKQIIMAENLRYKMETGCWAYDNKVENVKKYGYLYDWEAAKIVTRDKQILKGWHLPTQEDWDTLHSFLGGDDKKVYEQLKQDGSSGFNALFGGFRYKNGEFGDLGSGAHFWTDHTDGHRLEWGFGLYSYNRRAYQGYNDNYIVYSIRLFRD